jgi:SGNH hydrolase-like domain, acetyltransferase AlgX
MHARLALAVAAAVFGVAVTDIALRVMLNGPVYQMAWPEIPELSRFAPNSTADDRQIGDLGAMTADRVDDDPRQVKTSIDAFGFRNDPGSDQRALDLIVLGDSFGFGVGTTQDKTFASLLRDRYGRAMYNLSLPYTGPWAEYVNLTLEGRRLKIHEGAVLLWAIFSGNDLDDRYGELDVDAIPRSGAVARVWTAVTRVKNRSPLYQMLRSARYAAVGASPPGADIEVPRPFLNGKTLLFVQPYIEARSRTYADVVGHRNFGALRQTVAAGRRLADKMGVTLKMVFIPTKEEVYGWALDRGQPWSTPESPTPFGRAVSEIAAGSGIEFLDLTPTMVAASRTEYERSGKLLWWYDDTHWNEEGHALAAFVINRDLLRP